MTDRVHDGARCVAELTGRAWENWTASRLGGPDSENLVVEYALRPGCGRAEESALVVKFFDEADVGRHAFDATVALHEAIGRTPPPVRLAVAEPIHFDPLRGMLVQRKARGKPYPRERGRAWPVAAFRLTGRALAQLHRLEPRAGRPRTLRDHIDELIRPHPARLAESFPEFRASIESTLSDLIEAESSWPEIEPRPLHRDFQLRQLFVDDDRLWVVDWDLFGFGDPAFDVAYFLVYLENHLPAPLVPPAEDAFLAGYRERGFTALLDRIPVYRRFNYLRRACRRFRLRDRDWEARMRRMLGRIDSPPL